MRDVSRRYRRWAFESAALDLALRQAGRSLAEHARPRAAAAQLRGLDAAGRARRATSPRPPSAADACSSATPAPRFKLDPTNTWTRRADRGAGRHRRGRLARPQGPLQGHAGRRRDRPRALRECCIEAFPDAWLEDPDVTDETRPLLEPVRDRITWDAPIHSVDDVLGARVGAAHGEHQAVARRPRCRSSSRRTTSAPSAASAPTAAARPSSASAATTSSTWPRCSTRTRPTTSRRAASTARSCRTACRRARSTRASTPRLPLT